MDNKEKDGKNFQKEENHITAGRRKIISNMLYGIIMHTQPRLFISVLFKQNSRMMILN